MSESTPAMDRLRAATRQEHLRLEALPFFRALLAGDLSITSYVGLLRALSVVYEVFEQAMMQAQHPRLVAVWDSSKRKLPLIDRDLAYFHRYDLPQTPVASLRAHLLTQAIRGRAHDDPVSLLGYLYVLAGSTLGGLVLRKHIARTFALPGSDGLAYVSSDEKTTKAHWNALTQRMNSVLIDVAEQDRVIAAAAEAFTGIGHIIEALHPVNANPPRELARYLNPAAGSHGITMDARELQAALRAGERSWRQFPYYQWRYGERGRQFTRSDSAWLVTLAAHEQPVVDQQIRWLGRLLAARGMPQWMLELHLELLYEELVAAVPEQHGSYARLQAAAHGLRDQRRQYLSDQALAEHIAAFDQQVGSDWSARLPKTGGLLAAAVADEQSGITHAVTSIERWITDSSRFPSQWIEAVQMTIHVARVRTDTPHA
jgi:heme oxygenase